MEKRNKKNNPKNLSGKNDNLQLSRLQILLLIALLIVSWFVFSISLGFDFTNYDDQALVYNNKFVRGYAIQGISYFYNWEVLLNNPITLFTHAITYKWFGLNPYPYHLINVILHLVNISLVFIFSRLILKDNYAALFVAALFALHPQRAESVAWVAERKDVLCGTFFFTSLVFYYQYIQKSKWYWFVLTFCFSIFAIFSKFSAVVLPGIFVLMDYLQSRKVKITVLIEKVIFFVPVAFMAYIHFTAPIVHENNLSVLQQYTTIERLYFVGYAFTFYLLKSFIPFNLSAFYAYPKKIDGYLPETYYIYSIVAIFLILIILFLVFAAKKNNRLLLFSASFYIINIFLVLHFIPFGGHVVVADRYTYFAHVGLFMLIVSIYSSYKVDLIIEQHYVKRITIVIVLLYLIGLVFITVQRVKPWKDNITLWTDVINHSPNEAFPYNVRGISKKDRSDFDGAIQDYNKAIALDSLFFEAYINRGNLLNFLEKREEALADFDKALTIKPNYAIGLYNRGITKLHQGRYNDAIIDFDAALKKDSLYVNALVYRADAKINIQFYDSAIKDLNLAIKIAPDNAIAWYNRGVANFFLNNIEQSCADWKKSADFNYKTASEMLKIHCK